MLSSRNRRKPFGTSAENGATIRDKGTERKDEQSIEPRGSKVSSKVFHPKRESSQRAIRHNDDCDEKRRKSKTPKTNNLSSVGGTYAIQTEFVRRQTVCDATKKSKGLPDPSPVRRPDPISAFAPMTDTFVASSAQRQFQPSNLKVNAEASSKRFDHDVLSDMDTDSSTADNISPLMTSPHDKPDPDAISLTMGKKKGSWNEMKTSLNYKSEDAAASTGAASGANKIQQSKNEEPPTSNSERRLEPNYQLEEAMTRARNGPTDNTRVLAAMLNSCKGKSKRHNDATHTETSSVSLVGSTVGGASLQRSASADESEVTIQDYTTTSHTSKVTRASDIFRMSHSNSNPSTNGNNHEGNLNAPIHDVSSGCFLRRPTSVERERLSAQVTSQLRSGYTFPSQIHLPAGWQVRMSKSKGKPYYVHPDFGSTWHYPGLIISHHIGVQNEVFMGESIDVSKHTFRGSFFQKSTSASNEIRSTATMESSSRGIHNNFGHETADHTNDMMEQKKSAGAVSSEGKQADDSVVPQQSIDSKSGSSNTSQTECRTQDSNVNYDESVTLSGPVDEARETDSVENKCDLDSAADFEENGSNTLVDFQTEHDDLEGDNDDVLSPVDSAHRDGNSLTSDHVDVDALLRHETRTSPSPLVTIKETIRNSSGHQSSQVSLDDASVDVNRVHLSSRKQFQSHLLDDLSKVSGDVDKSAIEKARIQAFEDEDGFDNNGSGFDHDDLGREFDHNDSPRFDEHAAGGSEMEAEAAATNSKMGAKSAPVKKKLRKTFPPGPLCSLQMLDLIENGSLNTPLWRNGKRKRCTLTSLKRSREQQSDIRRRSR